jgi:hypothetical protein
MAQLEAAGSQPSPQSASSGDIDLRLDNAGMQILASRVGDDAAAASER